MTFNDDSRLDTGGVQKRGPGRGAVIGGGSVLLLVIGLVSTQLFGVDLSPLLSGITGEQQQSSSDDGSLAEQCKTGADANAKAECRIVGTANSLSDYWPQHSGEVGIDRYADPGVIVYDGSTSSACGTASNSVGPFYCPSDSSIYIDPTFFALLQQQFGAEGGPLAEMYVVAHEWGHHVQNLAGTMSRVDTQGQGATGGSVRTELQADCYAGAWMQGASTTKDAQGNVLLAAPTKAELEQAVNAAQSIGDDHIQEQAGMAVQPEGFTHGTSEQRVRWLLTGYDNGPSRCDTFTVSGNDL